MISLTSRAFTDATPIPRKHLGPGHGDDISPHLDWGVPPVGTTAWAITLTDDDAPGYDHWLVVLPLQTSELEEGLLPRGAVVGQGTRSLGYEGPCPPSGTHHYVFTLLALDIDPRLSEGFTRADFDAATRGHVVDSATLRGTYRPGLRHELGARKARLLGAVRRG
ncbi:YbhB/YbcL family Raf kinase inhibitor-like protein [Luteococcus peritonei]|uniref:YbhB/YbcL family Raf kinase inhibitor-like protein n=1 Tax=Luteococcus peritonei TaxID=88874 RepID=A0ABW4RU51_9ACTN